MHDLDAKKLIKNTLEAPFNKERFATLARELFNHLQAATFSYQGNYIFDSFKHAIERLERVGKYQDPEGKQIDVLIVYLKKEKSLERARTTQRNFIAKYLNGSRGGKPKEAALVAFVDPQGEDWRFSFVKMEYVFDKQGKVKEKFTSARRYSFLVGKNENSHTAGSRLLPLLKEDDKDPQLADLEEAFNVEKVGREFFEKYRELFFRLKEDLDRIVDKDAIVKAEFEKKGINQADFAKKLLGQIVFLYFLQKKGWFGVGRGKDWGEGDRRFLRNLFERAKSSAKNSAKNSTKEKGRNYFNDYLEPLFYQALRYDRRADDDYFSQFDCKIPFLNGGLFDPMHNYDWVKTDILLRNDLFSNENNTSEGDIGDGILDVFDRYNFTVKEDEPLEKEVAIDPEMLGRVFENLLEVRDRKSKGTYYTPREIVHYMCRESLVHYLAVALEGVVEKKDIEMLMEYGEDKIEHEATSRQKSREEVKNSKYKSVFEGIEKQAKVIDEKLAAIRVCDPAVGSGAFVVGMMNEIIRARQVLSVCLERKEGMAYEFKREAIRNCLYGVDIDAGAVEIAKLRLWLSLVVDEERREVVEPLPNLDYKVVRGNSLLGVESDLLNHHLFAELEGLKPLFFKESNARKKEEYKKKINGLIKEISGGHESFDFELYFSEVFHGNNGFDVVVGNPPYVEARNSAIFPKDRKKLYQNNVKKRWREKAKFITEGSDLLIYFFESSLKHLNFNGINTFITQNAWLSTDYGKKFQNFLLSLDIGIKIDESNLKHFSHTDSPNINTVISFF